MKRSDLRDPKTSREIVVSFLGAIWTALKGVPTVIALASTLLTLTIDPKETVSARWMVLAILVELAALVAMFELAWRAFLGQRPTLPRVEQARRPSVGSDPLLVLLEPSEMYSFGDMVTFYHVTEDQFEELLGVGAIVNVQQDGRIQALLQTPVPEQAQLIDRLASNEQALKQRLRVKLNVQRVHTAWVSDGGNSREGANA